MEKALIIAGGKVTCVHFSLFCVILLLIDVIPVFCLPIYASFRFVLPLLSPLLESSSDGFLVKLRCDVVDLEDCHNFYIRFFVCHFNPDDELQALILQNLIW